MKTTDQDRYYLDRIREALRSNETHTQLRKPSLDSSNLLSLAMVKNGTTRASSGYSARSGRFWQPLITRSRRICRQSFLSPRPSPGCSACP